MLLVLIRTSSEIQVISEKREPRYLPEILVSLAKTGLHFQLEIKSLICDFDLKLISTIPIGLSERMTPDQYNLLQALKFLIEDYQLQGDSGGQVPWSG